MSANGHVDEDNRVQARLIDLHDRQGLSWRAIAERDEFLGLTHVDLWGFANGRKPSARVAARLGLPPRRVRKAADVSIEQRRRLDEIAAGFGMNWSELCRALADGELVDKADNILALRAMPLPNAMLTDGLLHGLEEMRDALKGIYLAHGGEYHAAWKLVEQARREE